MFEVVEGFCNLLLKKDYSKLCSGCGPSPFWMVNYILIIASFALKGIGQDP
jgi:hypothetical protein